jgi:hypothetical protein
VAAENTINPSVEHSSLDHFVTIKSNSEDLEEQGNVVFRKGAKYNVSMSTGTSACYLKKKKKEDRVAQLSTRHAVLVGSGGGGKE